MTSSSICPSLDSARPRPSVPGELLAIGLCGLMAVLLTWPMVAHFDTRLGGDGGDPLQTLWSWRWLYDALASGQNPFFSHRVYYPQGATLVFATFDLPSAIVTLPLWRWLSPIGVHNAGVLFAFGLSAYGAYRLAYVLTGDRATSLCAALLFVLIPYHFAHLQGHRHLAAMGWLPLSVASFHRLLERGERRPWGAALLSGLFLGLATLSSFYYLLDAVILYPLLLLIHRRETFTRRFFPLALALGASALAVAGPLLVAILRARNLEPVGGAHDPITFSADLQAFFLPNGAQRLAAWWGGSTHGWTGNGAEIAVYAGYAPLLVALVGLWKRFRGVGGYLLIALVGALFALGPRLHIAGHVSPHAWLPYAWLTKLLPPIEFMGCPSRFGYVMYLGLIMAGAVTLSRMRRGRSRWAALLILLVPTALGAAEYTPWPLQSTGLPSPAPFAAWSADPTEFAVLDLSGPYRMMWNGTLHRKPMLGGNLTRTPLRLTAAYEQLPFIRALQTCSLSASEAAQALKQAGVRYVITEENRSCFSDPWSFPQVYRGEGLRIFEVR